MKKYLYVTILSAFCAFTPAIMKAQSHSLAEADTLVSHAERLANQGRVTDAMTLLGKARSIYETRNHTLTAEFGKCLHQMSYCYFMLDSLQLGFMYAQQAAEIRRETLGDTHDDYLMTMNNIGTYYFMTDDLGRAEIVYQEILSKCMARTQIPKRYSFYSTNAARVLLKQGKKNRAEQVLDSTILLARRDFGEKGKDFGDAALDCANAELAFGDYCKSASYMELALSAYEKFSDDYEKTLEKLGIIYVSREMCYNREKAIWISNLTAEHNEHKLTKPCSDLTCLTKRAEYHASVDKIEEAKNVYAQALNTKGTLQEQRDFKISYARFLSNQKMHADAALYYKLAAEDEKQLNGETKLYASSLYLAGLKYNISQKQSEAIDCLTRSALAYTHLGGKENLQKAYASLQSVGTTYSIGRHFEEAIDYYKRAMNGLKQWPQSEEYASALSDVAKTECNLGLFDSSLAHYHEALQIYDNLQMTNLKTRTLQMIQYTLTKAGREAEADQMNDIVNNSIVEQTEIILKEETDNLTMYKSVWGEDGFQYAQALGAIAEMEYNLGKYRDGTLHYSQYIPSIRSAFQQVFAVANADERDAIWSSVKNDLAQLITNIYDYPETDSFPNPEMCRLGYDAALLSKGILLNSSIEFMRVLEENGNKKAMEIYKQIEHNTAEILSMQTSAMGAGIDNSLLSKIREKKEQNAQLEIKLRNLCPELNSYTQYLLYTWHDVQKALGPKDMAIELVDVGEGVSYDHYIVALVLTKDADAPLAIPLCKRLILQRWLRTSSARVFDQDNKGEEFWASLIQLFEGKEHIYFSPEAEIHQIAVEYLKIGGVPVFEKYPLYRVSSTKEICKTSHKSKKQKMALFGDIEYAYGVEVASTRGDNLGELPNTKDEIENIASMYKKKKVAIDTYSKVSASETAFRKLSGKGVTMLHIASHGIYNAPKRASEQEAMRGSLLAFCGYNVVGADTLNDGKISAEDVAHMNLRDCNLVVLSACKTGLGEKGSDGIFGLQRGFKNAGVGTIVMSLRNVHDEATAQLMTIFYRELAAGRSKREALKKAMEEIRSIDKYKKAEYWASFIMLDGLD